MYASGVLSGGEKLEGRFLCKHVRLCDKKGSELSNNVYIFCLDEFGGLGCVSLVRDLHSFKQAQERETHTHTLRYFISTRHGWGPGPGSPGRVSALPLNPQTLASFFLLLFRLRQGLSEWKE